jgi:hypothetical protein
MAYRSPTQQVLAPEDLGMELLKVVMLSDVLRSKVEKKSGITFFYHNSSWRYQCLYHELSPLVIVRSELPLADFLNFLNR